MKNHYVHIKGINIWKNMPKDNTFEKTMEAISKNVS